MWRRRLSRAAVVLSWLAFICLLFWVPAQMFLTMMVLDQSVGADVGCAADVPKVELLAVTGGAMVAAFTALVLIKKRRSAALLAVAVEAGCVYAWVALGGFEAFDCVTNL
jgi:hypothetical protein